jgi:predicted alpha/beta-hydrolase family hydrolase
MPSESIQLAIKINDRDSVTAMIYPAAKKDRAGVTIILGHGAGAGQLHPIMTLFATGLAARGFDTLTFNFLYMDQGKHVPDPKAKLEACYTAVIEAARAHKRLKGNSVVIGGKSMGGRIASQVAATEDVAEKISGLVLLGYPLHPPGNPEKLRDAHLAQVKAPILIVQGSRDAFGSEDELRAVIKRLRLPATLHVVEGGDHSLKIPKSQGIPQPQVYENVMDEIARWLAQKVR